MRPWLKRLVARGPALALVSCSGAIVSCGAAYVREAAPKPAASTIAPTGAIEFPEDAAALPRYHSKRLELSLPLPRGSEWRIDDHSQPALVATHPPTHSRVLFAVLRADENVGRGQCQAMAEEGHIVPAGPFQALEDEVAITQQTFDTRIEVVLIPGDGPTRPLVGHVMAFGGFLRKCFVFDFATEVASAAAEDTLSSRLAFARARILGGLVLDSITSVTHAPAGTDVARLH